MTILSN